MLVAFSMCIVCFLMAGKFLSTNQCPFELIDEHVEYVVEHVEHRNMWLDRHASKLSHGPPSSDSVHHRFLWRAYSMYFIRAACLVLVESSGVVGVSGAWAVSIPLPTRSVWVFVQ